MDDPAPALAALADSARWRIVGLLAERPRSVGVIAELAGLRQPQATKHLQTLERAGLVISRRSGRRRVYAVELGPLRALTDLLAGLVATVDSHRDARDDFDEYFLTVEAESLAADGDRWADDRVFTFRRVLPVPRAAVWRHLTETELLRRWWAPRDLAVTEVLVEPRRGGRVVLEYRDADDATGTDGVVGRAEGVVDLALSPERLELRLSPLLPDGGVAFTGHYTYALGDNDGATVLDVSLRISDSTVESAEFVAGIEIGWRQSLDRLVATCSSISPTNPKDQSS